MARPLPEGPLRVGGGHRRGRPPAMPTAGPGTHRSERTAYGGWSRSYPTEAYWRVSVGTGMDDCGTRAPRPGSGSPSAPTQRCLELAEDGNRTRIDALARGHVQ